MDGTVPPWEGGGKLGYPVPNFVHPSKVRSVSGNVSMVHIAGQQLQVRSRFLDTCRFPMFRTVPLPCRADSQIQKIRDTILAHTHVRLVMRSLVTNHQWYVHRDVESTPRHPNLLSYVRSGPYIRLVAKHRFVNKFCFATHLSGHPKADPRPHGTPPPPSRGRTVLYVRPGTWTRHQPDLLSFNLALAACARKGEATKTLRLLGDMRKAGLLPTTVSFSTAVKSCERAGKADEVSRGLFTYLLVPDVM